MQFRTRKIVMPGDLNPLKSLFGGQLLKWIDEEAAVYASCQLGTTNLVTKVISEIDFVAPGKNGDIIEIGCNCIKLGISSITIELEVRNKTTKETIVRINKIVFVHIGTDGKPAPHGITQIKE